MEYEAVKALRDAWGDKPCNHPAFTDEILFGSRTGDYICTQCGKSFTQREKAKMCLQAQSPKVEQFLERSAVLKDRLETLSKRKAKLGSGHGNPQLDALLQEQEVMIQLADQLLQGLEQGL